nr:hypothetical protein [Tanacetum cinerariifolium]
MVAYLTKYDASEEFNQIIDFLNESYIHYALTMNPNIYVSCIKQFWNTVAIKHVNDVTRIQALVDKKRVVVTEAAIREVLRLDDAEGVDCLPNEEIFTGLARMGYEKPSTKLTFYKAFFSSQWKFLIHTILQCMSSKRTSWNEFSSSMASAIICLSTCRKFNFSKYIFDSLDVKGQLDRGQEIEEEGDADEHVEDVTACDDAHGDDIAAHGERVDTSDDIVMNDESNQGMMIAEIDKDDVVVLRDDKEEDKKVEEAKVVEIVNAVSEIITAACAIIPTAEPQVPAAILFTAHARVVAAPSRRRKGVLDYFKGMSYDDIRLVFEAKFNSNVDFLLKTKEQIEEEYSRALQTINETPKKQQIEMDEEYARKLHAELNIEESKNCALSSKGQKLEATGIMWCAYHNLYNHAADFVNRKELVQGIVHRCLQQDDILNDVHVAATDDSLAIPEHTTVETPMNMSPANKAHFEAEKEAIHLILTGIGDEIYSTVDACHTAHEMWETIERHKGKEIAKPITPPSETASKVDSDPEQAQRDKDMQKNLALIAKYLKNIYKPTNNNLETSSNSRNKNVDTTPWFKNDNQSGQFGNQRIVNVVGARNNVGSPIGQQSRIQCFYYKEFGHFAKECRKPKRVKESMYHKEKMLLCKQAEQGVPLQAEQYDWLADTDEEIDDNTCLVETDDSNVIPDSPDMCNDDIHNDQNNVESDDECVTLANLIANLKLDVDKNKKIQKQLKKANTTLAQELKEYKTILAETSKTLGESNRVQDSCLVALQNKQTEFEKYKAFNDRTVDYDKLEHKLNETLGQLALKDIKIKESLKTKAYEILVVKEKHDELIKQSLLTKSHYEGLVK